MFLATQRKTLFWLSIVLIASCAVLFVPYKSATSPRWVIDVVDASGKPVPDLPVRQEWSYFGIDHAPFVEGRRTDSRGRVEFPTRFIWASLVARLMNLQGASERLGPSVWIEACDDRSVWGELFWDGNRFALGGPGTRTARIVVRPSEHCTFS